MLCCYYGSQSVPIVFVFMLFTPNYDPTVPVSQQKSRLFRPILYCSNLLRLCKLLRQPPVISPNQCTWCVLLLQPNCFKIRSVLFCFPWCIQKYCNTAIAGSEFGVNNMKTWVHPALYQAVGGVMVWQIFIYIFKPFLSWQLLYLHMPEQSSLGKVLWFTGNDMFLLFQ